METKFQLVAPFTKSDVTASGQFSGRASVYNLTDGQGDCVQPGAFTKTLAKSGGRIKILNQHDVTDVIGTGMLTDRPDALWLSAQLVLALPSAQDAYTRLKTGLIDALSIGYSVVDCDYVHGVRQLKEVDLWEVSLVTFPANDAARITSVKRQQQKAGRVISAANGEKLRAIHGHLKSIQTSSEYAITSIQELVSLLGDDDNEDVVGKLLEITSDLKSMRQELEPESPVERLKRALAKS